MKISELKPRTGNAEVQGEVIAIQPARLFNKFGKEGRVANAKLKDDSGSITLTLWNEQIDSVHEGDVIKVTNGWISEWQGEMQLSTGKFGSLEIISSNPNGESADKPKSAHPQNKDAPRKIEPDEEVQEDEEFDEEDIE